MSQSVSFIPLLAILASFVIANHLDEVVNTLVADSDKAKVKNDIDSKIAYIAEKANLSDIDLIEKTRPLQSIDSKKNVC